MFKQQEKYCIDGSRLFPAAAAGARSISFASVQCLLCSRFKLFTHRTSPCRCRSFYRASLVKQRSSLHCHARRDMIHLPGNLSFIHRSPNVILRRAVTPSRNGWSPLEERKHRYLVSLQQLSVINARRCTLADRCFKPINTALCAGGHTPNINAGPHCVAWLRTVDVTDDAYCAVWRHIARCHVDVPRNHVTTSSDHTRRLQHRLGQCSAVCRPN